MAPLSLIVVPLLIAPTIGIILRSSDSVDLTVNDSFAKVHSKVLRDLVEDSCHTPVRVPNIAGEELKLIVEFVHTVVNDSQHGPATQWVHDKVSPMTLAAQCRLMAAADFLDIHALLVAIASMARTRSDLSAMREMLYMNALRLVVAHIPGIAGLARMAHTDEQRNIVEAIQGIAFTGDAAFSAGKADLLNNARWNEFGNVLHWAAFDGNGFIVDLLLNVSGIDANARNETQATPLHAAAATGHADIVETLLDVPDIDVNAPNNMQATPLHCAAYAGNVAVVGLLLKAPKIAVNSRDNDGSTPLHVAAHAGHGDVVELLLQMPGIEVSPCDRRHWTPLHRAAFRGRTGVVNILVGVPGVDINACDLLHMTPLLIATARQHHAVFELLLSTPGISVNVRDTHYMLTPLHRAAQRGNVPMVRALLQVPGIDLGARDQAFHSTPLHLAIVAGHGAVVQLLLNMPGIDVNAVDLLGRTPLDLANLFHHPGIAASLRLAAP